MGNVPRRGYIASSSDTRIHCRRLWPSDRAIVQAHFLRLDPETRANRFLAAVNDGTALAYAERAVVTRGVMFGAFVGDSLRGIGELRPAGPTRSLLLGRQAEAAFVVERSFRREGLGSLLFQRIAAAARSRGVCDLVVQCLNGNGAMRRLALKHGADLHPAGTEMEGALRLGRPTPYSLFSEGVADLLDFTLAFASAARTG